MGMKRDEWSTVAPVIDATVSALFWKSVDAATRAPDDCWPWMRSQTGDGYGAFMLPHQDGKRRLRKASRVAWALVNNRWPALNEVVMHTCDNRVCCNPRHLRLGTNDDNMRDMAEKGRASQGDGHWTRSEPARVSRGSAVGTSKLTEAQVAEIRRRIAASGGRRGINVELAEEFGVTRQLIWQIAKGKWWKHVTESASPTTEPVSTDTSKAQ